MSNVKPKTVNKFIAKLPDAKHYASLQSIVAGKFLWADKGSPLIRIEAPVPQPWQTDWVIFRSFARGKSDATAYAQRLTLKCFPVGDNQLEFPKVLIEREIYKAKFAYSQSITFFCAAFPYMQEKSETKDSQLLWLMYSFYPLDLLSINCCENITN